MSTWGPMAHLKVVTAPRMSQMDLEQQLLFTLQHVHVPRSRGDELGVCAHFIAYLILCID